MNIYFVYRESLNDIILTHQCKRMNDWRLFRVSIPESACKPIMPQGRLLLF